MADEVFAVKNDPDQLDVNQMVIERLLRIHPSAVSEYANADGPVAWILIIPTSIHLMQQFLEKKISEKELFELVQSDKTYDALYLCSAMVLPDFQRKGIAKRLILAAIENFQKDHPIKYLFAWPFSKEGDLTSETIASLTSLPLLKRHDQ